MKCLFCKENFEDLISSKQNYASEHNIDENNHFFSRLFTRDRGFCPRKCSRCEHFCIGDREEKIHSFIEHYQSGGNLPTELKPFSKLRFDSKLENYFITYEEHGECYNFFDSREGIEAFLTAFE